MPLYLTYGPANIDALLTTTLSQYRKTLQDNIYTAMPLFNWLYRNGKKETVDGGASILIPVMYEKNATADWYSMYGTINVTPQEGLTMAQYKFKQLGGSITIAGREERANRGRSAILNLLKGKTMQAELALEDKISTALFAASPASTAINSLVTLIDATSTIGDINSTTYSWWQATSTASGSFAAQGLSDMRTLYNTLSKYRAGDHPDVIITTQSVFEYYENLAQIIERITDTRSADLGFENLKFKGATMFFDENATSGVLDMLNSNHIKLVVDGLADFEISPFVKPENQDCRTAFESELQLQEAA